MAVTPILGIQQVAANQNFKETTINDGFLRLEQSGNKRKTVDALAGHVTLTTNDFQTHISFIVSGQTAAVNLVVPNLPRMFFVQNLGIHNVLVKTATGAAVTVIPSAVVIVVCDGNDVINLISVSSTATSLTKQDKIILREEGVDLGLPGEVTEINFVGGSVTVTKVGAVATVAIASGIQANAGANLTAGFTSTAYNAGALSSGTFTPVPANGNFQLATNDGAHILAPPNPAPGNAVSMTVKYTNGATANSIATSGFDRVSGDAVTFTAGHRFLFYINVVAGHSHLAVLALQ